MTYHVNNNGNISPIFIAIIEFISVIHGVIVLSLTMLKLIVITIIVVTENVLMVMFHYISIIWYCI